LRHLHRVPRAVGVRDRPHERLVAPPQVRVDHLEMPLVDRQVDRLTHRAAGVVQVRREVRELDDVAEVLDRPVPASAVEVAHERRPVRGSEHGRVAPDPNAVGRVPRLLDELRRRARLHDAPAHPPREPNALALNVGAGLSQRGERLGIAAELDADALEDRVRVVLDQLEPLLGEHLDRLQRARDERHVLGDRVEPRRLARRAPAAPSPGPGLAHARLLPLDSLTPDSSSCPRARSLLRPSRPPPTPAPARLGNGTTAASRSNGSVACGMPIASMKCSWNRGSTAVSTFSTRRTTSSISARAARFSSAILAPVPAALPAALTRSRSQSGTRPSTIACIGSMWLPNAPA